MSEALQRVRLGDRTVRYLDAGPRGTARVLVLLHAFPVGTRMWRPQLDAFDGWRIIAPALPGFDGSALLPEPSIDAYAGQVLGLLDELGVERALCGGLSMGGYVVFGLVRQAPARVTGLILADTRCEADGEQARAGRLRTLELVERQGSPGVARDMVPKLLGKTTLEQRHEVVESVTQAIEEQPADALAAATRAMMTRHDSEALLRGLALPALIIVGEEDTLTPPAAAARMHAATPGSTLVRIPGAGHVSSLENPDGFNTVVRRFLGTLA